MLNDIVAFKDIVDRRVGGIGERLLQSFPAAALPGSPPGWVDLRSRATCSSLDSGFGSGYRSLETCTPHGRDLDKFFFDFLVMENVQTDSYCIFCRHFFRPPHRGPL